VSPHPLTTPLAVGWCVQCSGGDAVDRWCVIDPHKALGFTAAQIAPHLALSFTASHIDTPITSHLTNHFFSITHINILSE